MSADKTTGGRPVLKLKRSTVDWMFEVLAAAAVIYGLVLLIPYADIPDRIPSHFNAAGEADGWGNKSLLLILIGTNVALYAALTVLSRFPHKLNYPWEITEGNARRQYELVLAMMSCLKAVISCVFTYITHTTVETAAGNSQGLGTAFLPIVLGGSFIPIVIYLVIANRNR